MTTERDPNEGRRAILSAVQENWFGFQPSNVRESPNFAALSMARGESIADMSDADLVRLEYHTAWSRDWQA